MKKLTGEEAENIPTRNGRLGFVRTILENMDLDENKFVFIEKSEMKRKGKTPVSYFKRIEKKTHKTFKCKTAADKSGWIIERIS